MSDLLDLESTLPQPPDHTPADIAGALLIDGLLRYHAAGDAVARERRVAAVLEAVGEQSAQPASAPFVRVPRWLITAAAILLATATLILFIPTEQPAQADIRQSLARLRRAGDLRFEVAVNEWERPDDTTLDTVDMRFPEGLLLVRHQTPWEPAPIVVGKDAQGYWSVRPDGSIDRTDAQRQLPPYIAIDGASLFEDSIDKLLERLPDAYEIERLPDAALKPGERPLERFQATRRKTHRARADTVLIWIDPAQHELERIEFSWIPPDLRKVEVDDGPGHRPPPPGDFPPHRPLPPDARGHGDGDRPPPRGDGHRPPPKRHRGPPPGRTPRSIIFQRAPVNDLPANWYTAEGHAAAKID